MAQPAATEGVPAAIANVPSEELPSTIERVTLKEAIEQALARNPSLVVAEREIDRSQALLREARAGYWPTLTGNATYTRLDNDRTANLGGVNRVLVGRDSLGANVTLSVPLVSAPAWVRASQAGDSVKVAMGSKADARRQIVISTARAYLTIVSQSRVVAVDDEAVRVARAHYEFAHTRLTGGVGNRIDEVRAAQQLATATTQLESAYFGLARSREALGVLLGVAGPVDVSEEPELPKMPPMATALDLATRRSDVNVADLRVRAADQVKSGDWAYYMPSLVGQFQPFYQNPATLTQPETGWQAFLVLSLPFYDGGLRYGLAEEHAALAAEARAQLDGIVRQAKSDVRTAYEELRRADAALQSAHNAARLAKESLDLATLAYRAGATTNLEVIDAERQARDAATADAIAEDAARQARLDLLVACGAFP
jgi:outer membrane protein TolC